MRQNEMAPNPISQISFWHTHMHRHTQFKTAQNQNPKSSFSPTIFPNETIGNKSFDSLQKKVCAHTSRSKFFSNKLVLILQSENCSMHTFKMWAFLLSIPRGTGLGQMACPSPTGGASGHKHYLWGKGGRIGFVAIGLGWGGTLKCTPLVGPQFLHHWDGTDLEYCTPYFGTITSLKILTLIPEIKYCWSLLGLQEHFYEPLFYVLENIHLQFFLRTSTLLISPVPQTPTIWIQLPHPSSKPVWAHFVFFCSSLSSLVLP